MLNVSKKKCLQFYYKKYAFKLILENSTVKKNKDILKTDALSWKIILKIYTVVKNKYLTVSLKEFFL